MLLLLLPLLLPSVLLLLIPAAAVIAAPAHPALQQRDGAPSARVGTGCLFTGFLVPGYRDLAVSGAPL